jgi:hypothetical protein
MDFIECIQNTLDVANCLHSGLQALQPAERAKLDISNPRALKGSVDIDTCTKAKYPAEPRWDYVIGYQQTIYYVEFHPANAGEVSTILIKLQWLRQWQNNTLLIKLQGTYHWIASGDIGFTRSSRYSRQLALHGIHGPAKRLKLM